MQIVCCVCDTIIKEAPAGSEANAPVSHGLCPPCAHSFRAQMGMTMTTYIEGFDVPILVLDANGNVSTANTTALKHLHKTRSEVQAETKGMVFDCEHALLPEGCGHTIHCSGCVIRQSVTSTIETGQSHSRVPATIRQTNPDGPQTIELLISTEFKGGVVLLRVDEFPDTHHLPSE